MFSMENRRGAVDLCFTEGMTIRKVVAELGYPSEGARAKDRPRSCAQAWQFLSESLMGVAFSALCVQNAAFQNGFWRKIPHFKVGFGARCRANGESGVFVGAAG